MREVDESLELMKRDHKRRMDICEQRRLKFEEKQGKMREQVLKFEKFIQENDAKRIRAEVKAKQERKLYEEKVREISTLNDEVKRLEVEQTSLDKELSKSFLPFEFSIVITVLSCFYSQKGRTIIVSSWRTLWRTVTTDMVICSV